MLSLDSPRWVELQHAYGSAADIPPLLKQLEAMPFDDGNSEPWFSLWSALAHQGDVYPASFAAVPHVIACLAQDPLRASSSFVHFPAWVEACRHRTRAEIPPDLLDAYTHALKSLPALVAAAADKPWDEDFLLCALAAIAAAKGYPSVAEASLELSSDVLPDFQEWLESR